MTDPEIEKQQDGSEAELDEKKELEVEMEEVEEVIAPLPTGREPGW